jgi:hypothetical protein
MTLSLLLESDVWLVAVEVVATYGPCAGFLATAVTFVRWRSWKHEARRIERIEQLETEIREVLIPRNTLRRGSVS